jgi:hypothetical protein
VGRGSSGWLGCLEGQTVTPQQLAANLLRLSPEELQRLDHATLYSARGYVPREQQNLLAPFEHRAFAREAVQENPLMALPIATGSLLYQPYKALMGSRSAPAWNQVGQGLLGVGEGLWQGARGLLR